MLVAKGVGLSGYPQEKQAVWWCQVTPDVKANAFNNAKDTFLL